MEDHAQFTCPAVVHPIHILAMGDLQRWMKRRKVDDDYVAEKTGISRSQVSRIRRLESRPSQDSAERLAALTRIPWHRFMAVKPKKVIKAIQQGALA